MTYKATVKNLDAHLARMKDTNSIGNKFEWDAFIECIEDLKTQNITLRKKLQTAEHRGYMRGYREI